MGISKPLGMPSYLVLDVMKVLLRLVLFCVVDATTVTRSQEGKFPSKRLPRTHRNRAHDEKSLGEINVINCKTHRSLMPRMGSPKAYPSYKLYLSPRDEEIA